MKAHFTTLFLMASCLLHCATTYVIKENGAEVGRWEENDGSQEVKIVDNDLSQKKAPPAPIEPEQPITGEPGYQGTEPKIPEGDIAQWKVSGRVINILTLAGAGPGEITFSYNKLKTVLKISSGGAFTGSIPQVKGKSYTISVKVPGYDGMWVDLRKPGDFASIPYKERLQMRNGAPQWAAIGKTTYDMEIGLSPVRLTAEQAEAFHKHMREVAGGSGNEETIS